MAINLRKGRQVIIDFYLSRNSLKKSNKENSKIKTRGKNNTQFNLPPDNQQEEDQFQPKQKNEQPWKSDKILNPQICQIIWRRDKLQQKQYLVRYKGRSYLHLKWVSESEILQESKSAKNKLNRFNRAFQKKLIINQQLIYEQEKYFDPSYTEVDRIIFCTSMFPVIHQKRAQVSKPFWLQLCIIVTQKLLNFTKNGIPFGIYFLQITHNKPDSNSDNNWVDIGTIQNRCYLEWYNSGFQFWQELGQLWHKYLQLYSDQTDYRLITLKLRECSLYLYKEWNVEVAKSVGQMEEKLLEFQGRKIQIVNQIIGQNEQDKENSQLSQLQQNIKNLENLIETSKNNSFNYQWIGESSEPQLHLDQADIQQISFANPTNTLYLIKWKNVSYTESTWEPQSLIQNPEKIRIFKAFNRALDKELRNTLLSNNEKHQILLQIEENSRKILRMGNSYINQIKKKLYNYGIANRKQPLLYSVKNPPIYKDKKLLRSYQLQSLNWIIKSWYEQRNVILADQMGLGKTIQSIAFLNHLIQIQNMRGPFLVIAPLSTLQHWKRTVQQWTNLNGLLFYDSNGQQGRQYLRYYQWNFNQILTKGNLINNNNLIKFHIMIVSYEVFQLDFQKVIQFLPFQFIVVDQAHRLKNQNAKILATLKKLPCKRVMLLTGTPIQNNTNELWTLLNYIEPKIFNSLESFNLQIGDLTTSAQVQNLLNLLKPFLLRRKKQDVEQSIPPLQQTIIDIQMTNFQKTIYRALYQKNKAMLLKGAVSYNINNTSLNNLEIQLRKCCNHPFLIKEIEIEIMKGIVSPKDRSEKLIQSSGKMILLSKLLDKFKKEQKKVLIFSQFINMLTLIQQLLDLKQLKFERIDGQTKAKQRQNSIDRFNNSFIQRDVFLLSTKAGGIGINLTAANIVIIYDSDWNPQNDVQATARAHRIGQQNQVAVYRLVTKKTYEAEMFQRATKKLGLDQAIFLSGSFKNNDIEKTDQNRKLSKIQIQQLLKKGIIGLVENEEKNVFFQDDIENILAKNSRIAKYSLINGSYSFSMGQFVSQKTNKFLSLDDPNFWNKALLNVQSKTSLLVKRMNAKEMNLEEQKLLMISISESVNELIESKLSLSGYNADDQKNLMECLSRINNNKNWCKGLRDTALTWIDQIRKPSRRFKRYTSEQIQQAITKQSTSNLTDKSIYPCIYKQKLDDVVVQSGDQNQDKLDKQNNKKEELIQKLCFQCQKAKCSHFCNGYCKRSFHKACMNNQTNDKQKQIFQLSLDQQNLKKIIVFFICIDCLNNQVMCFVCKQKGKYFGSQYIKNKKQKPNLIKLKRTENQSKIIQQDEYQTKFKKRKNQVTKCSTANCAKFFHHQCINQLPYKYLFKFIDNKSLHFRCSLHYCNKCQKSGDTMAICQCIRCPRALHMRCMDKDKVLKVNKKMIICEKHKPKQKIQSTIHNPFRERQQKLLKESKISEPKQFNCINRKKKNQNKSRRYLRSYQQSDSQIDQQRLREQNVGSKQKKKIYKLDYNDLKISAPKDFDYENYKYDWCKYCGARFHSNFTQGPWGPKTLCTVHYLNWKKQKTLNLNQYVQKPIKPIDPENGQQLRYLSELKSRQPQFDAKYFLIEGGFEQYRKKLKKIQQ